MWLLAAALPMVLLVASCRQPAAPPEVSGPAVPARVLTIRTRIEPGDRTLLHRIVVAESRIRLTSEADRWRLFDFEARTVTTVDEINRTVQVEPFDLFFARKEDLFDESRPNLPRAELIRTEKRGRIAGIEAVLYEIRLGGYVREIWLSTEPLVHEDFFPVWVATQNLDPAGAGVLRDVYRQLIELRGFPLLDRSEMRFGGETLQIERRLMSVESTEVPENLLRVPLRYEVLGANGG